MGGRGMPPLALPDVTIFLLHGGVATELSRMALCDTLARVAAARTIVLTPEPDVWGDFPVEIVEIARCLSLADAQRVLWYVVPPLVETSHMMHVEWDGWVVDPTMWDDEYLEYDYVGAPWPFHDDEYKVGNGLALRSARLMKFLANRPGEFPLPTREDHTLCREYRPFLEKLGFRFAPLWLATKFSWERGAYPGRSFLFHGAFNWPRLLTPRDVAERIAAATPYERSKVEWPELIMNARKYDVR